MTGVQIYQCICSANREVGTSNLTVSTDEWRFIKAYAIEKRRCHQKSLPFMRLFAEGEISASKNVVGEKNVQKPIVFHFLKTTSLLRSMLLKAVSLPLEDPTQRNECLRSTRHI